MCLVNCNKFLFLHNLEENCKKLPTVVTSDKSLAEIKKCSSSIYSIEKIIHKSTNLANKRQKIESVKEENWGGLNTPRRNTPRQRRSLYSILIPQKTINPTSKIVGHLLHCDKINKNRANFRNTCGFDAMIACFCAIENDINEALNFGKNPEIILLIDHLNSIGFNQKANTIKENLLVKIFNMKTNTQFLDIDCNNNITFFLEGLDFESYNLKRSCDCMNMNKTMVNAFIYLNVSSPADLKWKLSNLIDTIRPQKNLKCSIGHTFVSEYNFNDIVCFQLTYFTEKNLYNIISNEHIPEEIAINTEIYILKSIVNFRPPQLKASIGHYQAFCRRTRGNWEVYDNSCNNILSFVEFILPHLIIYVKKY